MNRTKTKGSVSPKKNTNRTSSRVRKSRIRRNKGVRVHKRTKSGTLRNKMPQARSKWEAKIMKQTESGFSRTSLMIQPGHAGKTLSSIMRANEGFKRREKIKARNAQAAARRKAAAKARLAKKRAEAMAVKNQLELSKARKRGKRKQLAMRISSFHHSGNQKQRKKNKRPPRKGSNKKRKNSSKKKIARGSPRSRSKKSSSRGRGSGRSSSKGRASSRGRGRNKKPVQVRKKGPLGLTRQQKLKKDVRSLCVVGKLLWEGSRDGIIRIRDLQTAKQKKEIGSQSMNRYDTASLVAIKLQFNKVWVADSHGQIRAYTTDAKHIMQQIGSKHDHETIIDMWVSELFGKKLVVSCNATHVFIRSLLHKRKTRLLWKLYEPDRDIMCLCIDNYQQQLWIGDAFGIKVWDRAVFEEKPKNAKREFSIPKNRTKLVIFDQGRMGFKNNGAQIIDIAPESQAERLGVTIGWKILEINDKVQGDESNFNEALEKNKKHGKPTKILFSTITAKDIKEYELKCEQEAICASVIPLDGGALSLCAIDGSMWSGGTSEDGNGEISIWRTSDYKLMKKMKLLDVPSVDNIQVFGQYVFGSSSRAGVVGVWDRVTKEVITIIQVTLNTKIITMVQSPIDGTIWMGGRNPGALVNYTLPPRFRASERKDNVACENIDVDARTFRKWISHILKSDPVYEELDEQRAERTVLVTFEPGKKGFANSQKTITAVGPDTQAGKAGVCAGWRITKVNGKNPGDHHDVINHSIDQNTKLGKPTTILFTVGSLPHAIHDGVLLCALLSVLDKDNMIKVPNIKPVTSKHKWINIKKAFTWMKKKKIKLRGIKAKQIETGDIEAGCNLVWEIIRKYHIEIGFDQNRTESALQKWVNVKLLKRYMNIEEGIFPVSNWDWNWCDGYLLSAVVDSQEASCVAFGKLEYDDPLWNVNTAMQTAQEKFNIPRILDYEDMVFSPTSRSVMTYVAFFRCHSQNKPAQNVDVDMTYFRVIEPEKKKRNSIKRRKSKGRQGSKEDEDEDEVDDEWATFGRLSNNLKKGNIGFEIFPKDENGNAAALTEVDFQIQGPGGELQDVIIDRNDDRHSMLIKTPKPLKSGRYSLMCKLGNNKILSLPSEFVVNQNVDSTACSVEGPGLGGEFKPTDTKGQFTVFARDDKKEPVIGADCAINMYSKNGPVYVEVTDNGDGSFLAEYELPLRSGEYTVDILVNDNPIDNSPSKFTIFRPAEPGNCFAECPGLESVKAAGGVEDPATDLGDFTIFARDTYGDAVSQCECNLTIKGPHGLVEVDLTNGEEEGKFYAQYDPQDLTPGEYTIDSTINGEHIDGFPFQLKVLEHFAEPKECFAEGGGLYSPEDCIRLEQEFNSVLYGNKDVIPPHIQRLSTLSVRSNESLLSSREQFVEDYDDDFDDFEYKVGHFMVYVLDKRARPVSTSECEIKIMGPDGEVDVTLDNHQDGTFTVEYDAELLGPGTYTIDITVDGNPIQNSPYKFQIRKIADTIKSTATGPGLTSQGCDSGKGNFTVFARCSEGTPVIESICECTITGPNGEVDVQIDDIKDGSFNLSYYAPLGPGEYSVEIKINGQSLATSPQKFTITSELPNSYAEGPGLNGPIHSKNAKDPTEIKVFAMDAESKFVQGTKCAILSRGPSGELKTEVIDNGDGTFTCNYKSSLNGEGTLPPGDYWITPTINGKPVLHTPTKFNIPKPFDSLRSIASGPGLEHHKLGSGRGYFDIFVKDKLDQPVYLNVDHILINILGPDGNDVESEAVMFPESQDGDDEEEVSPTHCVIYRAVLPGEHIIDVKLGGISIKDMPRKVMIKNLACASKTEGLDFTFTVRTIDENGELKVQGGDDFMVDCRREGIDPIDIVVKDLRDGSYSASYHLNGTSVYSLDCFINGEQIGIAPLFHDLRTQEQRDAELAEEYVYDDDYYEEDEHWEKRDSRTMA